LKAFPCINRDRNRADSRMHRAWIGVIMSRPAPILETIDQMIRVNWQAGLPLQVRRDEKRCRENRKANGRRYARALPAYQCAFRRQDRTPTSEHGVIIARIGPTCWSFETNLPSEEAGENLCLRN